MIFACCQDGIQISMGKEYSSPNEIVRRFLGNFFYSVDEFFGKMIASKLNNEFVVVDFFVGSAGYRIWIDHKIFGFLLDFFLGGFFFLLDLDCLLGFGLFHQLYQL